MNLKRENIRLLAYYCWKKGLNGTGAANEINETLEENHTSSRNCQRWYSSFTQGNFKMKDKERSGRPNKDVDQLINNTLANNRQSTCRSIALEIGDCCHKTIRNYLTACYGATL